MEGWSKANGGEAKPEAPTDEEHDALVATRMCNLPPRVEERTCDNGSSVGS